ncbi:MAG: hypothetical protein FWD51_00955 [Betaproteobacteria bacterium]|nr:hypothetical protein [Betaproteobacteria bacterium]
MQNERFSHICRIRKLILGFILPVFLSGSVWAHSPGEIFMHWPSLVMDAAGTPYVAYTDRGSQQQFTVAKFEKGAWVSMGLPGASLRWSMFPSLALDATGVPYVAFIGEAAGRDRSKFMMMKFGGDAWVPVSSPSHDSGCKNSSIIHRPLAFNADGELFVACTGGYVENNNIRHALSVMKSEGGARVSLGVLGVSAENHSLHIPPSMALSTAGVPFFSYLEVANDNSTKLLVGKIEGGTGVPVGSVDFPPKTGLMFSSMALDGAGIPYVAYTDVIHDNKLSVVRFSGGRKVHVGLPGFTPEKGMIPSLAFDKAGVPYVAYVRVPADVHRAESDDRAGRLSVMKFEGGKWVSVGSPGFSLRVAGLFSLALDASGVPYVAYKGIADDEANVTKDALSVMKFEGGKWIFVGQQGISFGKAEPNTEQPPIATRSVPPKTQAQRIETVKRAAEEGDARAQFDLGRLYVEGKGVPRNDAEAVKWFRKAAEQGNALAQSNLGWMYIKGFGVARNNVEAAKWYRKAAEQGVPDAQNMLGVIYSKGVSVEQNYAEALRWFTLAAENGSTTAQQNLSRMYANGDGVPRNDAESVKWLRKAAEQGLVEAQADLGVMYVLGRGVEKDNAEALKWYRKAAEQGNAKGQNNLGSMYYNGLGVAQDDAEAMKWYVLAAEQGFVKALFNIGGMHAQGRGVPQNDAEAVKWYKKAAKKGDKDAQTALQKMGK